MKKCSLSWFLIGVMTICFYGVSQGSENIPITKDLTSVIALLGLPCGKVVKVEKKGENDHIASCENGNRYRIFLNSEGRVIAKKQ